MKVFLFLLYFAVSKGDLYESYQRRNEVIEDRERIVSSKYFHLNNVDNRFSRRPIVIKSNLDWMKYVKDQKFVSELSIPGTHESCNLIGGPDSVSQRLTLQEQLEIGVRAFDIRCHHISDVFMINHQDIYQGIAFSSGVRDVCIDFLNKHPSEFILIFLKEESQPFETTRSFAETLGKYIKGKENYFYLNEDVPTVKEARGKIIIFRRFKSSIRPLGNFIDFKENEIFTSFTSIIARIQNCKYVKTIHDCYDKWEKVKIVLDEARNNVNALSFYINFINGAGENVFPSVVDDYVKPLLGSYLEDSYPSSFCGIIMADFIESGYDNLISLIIQRNLD
ncbi:phosphatidylinositol diacylglycerol-lyase [Tritrichomonas foetus]|uniref:Phosphatidylinositol diacylglycerol-lyase n=1 Tax=Tritrichomonas foetus TaxID=1144522 RepID=A0A1J4KBM1_9EUKA|nr:phosphatidylinositol diacylglycerol-lyase [Tritrichomonas foetus]|eukprot:OHT08809.1 phosphatidylinositol diacylglycerol-lyase [Tritrichomonas foetus]